MHPPAPFPKVLQLNEWRHLVIGLVDAPPGGAQFEARLCAAHASVLFYSSLLIDCLVLTPTDADPADNSLGIADPPAFGEGPSAAEDPTHSDGALSDPPAPAPAGAQGLWGSRARPQSPPALAPLEAQSAPGDGGPGRVAPSPAISLPLTALMESYRLHPSTGLAPSADSWGPAPAPGAGRRSSDDSVRPHPDPALGTDPRGPAEWLPPASPPDPDRSESPRPESSVSIASFRPAWVVGSESGTPSQSPPSSPGGVY